MRMLQKSVVETPNLSVKKPPNFDPKTPAIPKIKSTELIFSLLTELTKCKKGVI
jgi:hypothetical protein